MIEGNARQEVRSRAAVLGLLVAALVAAGLLVAKPAHASTTFTVNSTSDAADPDNAPDGTCDSDAAATVICTLREAIFEANNNANPDQQDTIEFNISGNGPHTISPSSTPLPVIIEAVSIDGYSQGRGTTGTTADDARQNTNAQGALNAVLKIRLDGNALAATTGVQDFVKDGLFISAPNVVVRGLSITRFSDAGMDISGSAQNVRIEGNFIGTDPVGTADFGNLRTGVQASSMSGESGGQIGDSTTPAARNLISGNNSNGISLSSNSPTARFKIEGNLIGTQIDGTSELPNNSNGVGISGASNNVIGGNSAAAENVIAHNNCGRGVVIGGNDSTGNRISRNSIFENGCRLFDLGIDLFPSTQPLNDAVTSNDEDDPDTGPNDLQNFPELASATLSGEQVTVTGTLNSIPSTQTTTTRKKKKKKKKQIIFLPQAYTIQFFSNRQVDQSGFGEGQKFIGQAVVVTNLSGDAPINRTFTPEQAILAQEKITATATKNSTGDTSEFSAPVEVD